MELEISNQKFMFNVAREINQPIATINENTERLLNETAQDPELYSAHQDTVEQLRNHVDQLKTVSEELIRFSQIAIKPTLDDKESVNMKTLLDAVITDFQPHIITKSINLISMSRPVELSGIPDQLKSIIEQLLSNAVKYSPNGGEIRIMLRDSGTQMELEIEDEGPGIDPDDLPHIFEPFFRGKSSLPDECSEGSGLGLAIVKEYVANHQGKVDIIDSRQGQQGARILVQIPLTEED
jgi:two-component system sensor histidine kinase GlrK